MHEKIRVLEESIAEDLAAIDRIFVALATARLPPVPERIARGRRL